MRPEIFLNSRLVIFEVSAPGRICRAFFALPYPAPDDASKSAGVIPAGKIIPIHIGLYFIRMYIKFTDDNLTPAQLLAAERRLRMRSGYVVPCRDLGIPRRSRYIIVVSAVNIILQFMSQFI